MLVHRALKREPWPFSKRTPLEEWCRTKLTTFGSVEKLYFHMYAIRFDRSSILDIKNTVDNHNRDI